MKNFSYVLLILLLGITASCEKEGQENLDIPIINIKAPVFCTVQVEDLYKSRNIGEYNVGNIINVTYNLNPGNYSVRDAVIETQVTVYTKEDSDYTNSVPYRLLGDNLNCIYDKDTDTYFYENHKTEVVVVEEMIGHTVQINISADTDSNYNSFYLEFTVK